MRCRSGWVITPVAVAALAAATSDADSARKKLNSIESDTLPAGAHVTITYKELTAWAQQAVPEGVRNPTIQVTAPQTVTGSALVDFGKVRRAEGHPPGWLASKFLDGERPVSVTAHITSSGGQAQVDVERVAISGLVVDGATLDFLIQNILLPLYPDAAVNRPFALSHRMDRLELGARSVDVVIGR